MYKCCGEIKTTTMIMGKSSLTRYMNNLTVLEEIPLQKRYT